MGGRYRPGCITGSRPSACLTQRPHQCLSKGSPQANTNTGGAQCIGGPLVRGANKVIPPGRFEEDAICSVARLFEGNGQRICTEGETVAQELRKQVIACWVER